MSDESAARDGAGDESRTDGEGGSLSRDQAVRDIVKGASVVYVGLVLNMAIAFLAQRFAAVHLSIDGFGGLTTGTALLNVGGIVAGLGLSSGLTRYLPRVDDDQRRPLVRYALALTLPLGLLLGGAVVLSAEFLAVQVFDDPTVAVSLRIFGAVIPFAAVLNLAIGGIRGQEVSRYRVYVKNLLHPTARFGLVAVAVLVGLGQAGFATAYAAPFVLSAVLGLFLLNRTLPASSDRGTARRRLPEVIRYSLPFTVSGLASFVYRSIDIFLLLFFLDSRAVGVYGVAYAFSQLLGMFSTAFNYLGSPVSSRLESDDRIDDAIDVQRSIARWLVTASAAALVPMVLLAPDLLRVIYRPAYAAGGLTLSILAVGFATNNVLFTNNPLLQAIGRSKEVAFNTATAAAVNVGINLVLIPRYGIEGAAVATTISYVLLGLLPTVEMWYHTGGSAVDRSLLGPAVIAVPAALVGYALLPYLPRTLLWMGAFGAVYAAVYVVAVVGTVGLTQTDVMLLRSVEEKYGIDLGPVDALIRWLS